MIACVVIPDVLASVELNNCVSNTPLVLLNGSGKVQAASLTAAHQGIRRGMRIRQAQALCSAAQFRPFNATPYEQFTGEVLQCLTQFTHRVELAPGFWHKRRPKREQQMIHPSAVVVYLDLGKLRDRDALLPLADQIQMQLQTQFGYRASVGLASSRFTASIAARLAGVGQVRWVKCGDEAAFLASLPVTVLPLDAETLRRLRLFGLHTLGQLASLPPGALAAQFGKAGRWLYQLARGEDNRPVLPQPDQKVEHLTLRLHGAVEDQEVLKTILSTLACDLESRLNQQQQMARALELILYLDNGGIHSEAILLRQSTGDGQQLTRCLLRLLSRLKWDSGVTGIEIKAGELAPIQWRQLELFASADKGEDRLQQLLTDLAWRFGEEPFYQASISHPDHPLLERRFLIDVA